MASRRTRSSPGSSSSWPSPEAPTVDWTRVARRQAPAERPPGAYVSLDELIRIRFRARDFSFLPEQPVNSVLAGRYASRLRGRGLSFEELRGYQSGDDVRTMDWRVTARLRSPHVRVYTEEKDRAVLLLVDQRINMFFGTRERMKSVTAAQAAALGGWRALDVGDRAGGICFDDSRIVEVAPKRGQQTLMALLGHIVEMNQALRIGAAEPAPGMLNRALEAALKLATHDGLIVVISDFFGVDAVTERLITRLAAHNDVLGILVHDPIRMDPRGGPISVSDGRLQIPLDLADARVRERIGADYRREQADITRFLRKLSAPLLTLSNQGDVVDQVRRLLGVPSRGGR